MNRRTISLAVVVAACGLIPAGATAQGPIMRRLLPKDDVPAVARATKHETYIPGARLAEGTKKLFVGARKRMRFWDKKDSHGSNAFVEGTGRFFRPDLAQREDEKKRRYLVRPATWFESEPEPPPGPSSVSDWIGQPRVGFD